MPRSKYVYVKKTDRLNRSVDFVEQSHQGDPWKLLASAIVFQAAVDCQNWTEKIERPCFNSDHYAGIVYRRRGKLQEFINSEWLDWLLCWQDQISIEAVRAELQRRLDHASVSE